MNPETLPIARLQGVIENPGEHRACSLVFVLQTKSGQVMHLTYGMLMQALHFAQEQGAMAELSPGWWARADGCGCYNEWKCDDCSI
ncbi:MAG: hypothetical protein LBI48_09685 [Burkholderiaceae bacterium]|jgi:hypothetical protein|nr:hypothetical protein [Burkholderiaceae bacterium]